MYTRQLTSNANVTQRNVAVSSWSRLSFWHVTNLRSITLYIGAVAQINRLPVKQLFTHDFQMELCKFINCNLNYDTFW